MWVLVSEGSVLVPVWDAEFASFEGRDSVGARLEEDGISGLSVPLEAGSRLFRPAAVSVAGCFEASADDVAMCSA